MLILCSLVLHYSGTRRIFCSHDIGYKLLDSREFQAKVGGMLGENSPIFVIIKSQQLAVNEKPITMVISRLSALSCNAL